MIPICGRCGRVFLLLDLTVVMPGTFRRHYVFCPPRMVSL